MGTRGFVGFVGNGRETIVYNHWDSYPSGVGIGVLEFARVTHLTGSVITIRDAASTIKHVSEEVPPTPEEVQQLLRFSDMSVSNQGGPVEWYQLLHRTHGSPAAIIASQHAEHDAKWPGDSLFCEWGYLLDLDTETFEVYEGFQREAHTEGRFHDRPLADCGSAPQYYPVRLVASWPLADLPSAEDFITKLEPDEDDDE